jgi:hypothetical protein
MRPALRQQVRARAGDRCEYCRLRQEHEPDRSFHAEHIIATQHRGGDELENLALACQLCNLLKGPNLSSIDPDTEKLERLFHPRKDEWAEHFRLEGAMIVGTTAIGRTTAWLLEMNGDDRVELRATLIELGEWP